VGLWDRIHQDEVQTSAEAQPAGPPAAATGPTIAEAVETAQAPAAARREVWGRPSACPKCGGHGYLDRIDVVDRIMYEHCTECFHKWQVAESQTEKSNS
jgi:hypothetical protein